MTTEPLIMHHSSTDLHSLSLQFPSLALYHLHLSITAVNSSGNILMLDLQGAGFRNQLILCKFTDLIRSTYCITHEDKFCGFEQSSQHFCSICDWLENCHKTCNCHKAFTFGNCSTCITKDELIRHN